MSVHPSGAFIRFRKEDVEGSIPERFEQIVAKHADRVAVTTRKQSLTYKDLDEAANRVARHLLACLGQRSEPIALLLEQDPSAIVAILGVLKAGKFYVPLDPRHPNARNSYILSDTQVPIVLTNQKYHSRARELVPSADLLDIDTIKASTDTIGLSVSPDDLAYLIYTSGSTGTPKGVMQNHRNVLHRTMAYTNSVSICADDRLALLYSYSSSGAVRDIFGALLNGATLLPFDVRYEGSAHLADWLIQEEITVYNSAATLFRHFAETLTEKERFPKLRLIHVGSETIYKKDVELYKAHFSDECLFVARLGCTEISPIREYPVHKETEITGNTVPAGYGVDETEVLLLDGKGGEVSFNEIGEIAVRSRYLFPGYWRRPELTRAAFLADPKTSDERIYRTGDLGRMRSDGCLEHLGRKDFQVKIRGHRVEIEEIEAALRQHPEVRDAAVAVVEETSGDKRLAAYVVLHQPQAGIASDLGDYLEARLPDYMFPSSFLMLDSLPLTPNGKLDRVRLPQCNGAVIELARSSARPHTTLEKVLAEIWAAALGLDEVGIDSNFFHVGGHSLLAMQVVSRIRNLLQVDLPLRTLFENPTLSGLASAIMDDPANAARILSTAQRIVKPSQFPRESVDIRDDQNVPRTKRRGAGPVPLSLTQQQLWFIDQLMPGSSTYNMARTFQLSGRLNVPALEQSLNEIVRRHESLRTTFAVIHEDPVQLIAPALTVTVSVVDLTTVSESERTVEAMRLASEEARRPYDLARGPLLRSTLLRLGDSDHLFLVGMHHIVSDGWSWRVFQRELAALYDAFSTGKSSPLSELPFQYSDFAQWQYEWLQGDTLDERLSYWKKRLDGAPALLELPTDYPRRTLQTFRGATQSEMFSLGLTEKLKFLSRQEGVTLFMTLLGAFNALLLRWTGQEDLVVGSAIAGRNREELEELIGLFINTLVLRTDLSGNPTFRDLLSRVREVTLGAYANPEVPFDKLFESLQTKRGLGQGTLFQVFFILNQETLEQNLKLSGVTVSKVPVEMGTVKFDLTVTMAEKADGLSCSFKYQTDLFDAATIQRMAEHFRTLLEGVVANPDAPLSKLPILSESERLQILVGWNDTTNKYPQDRCIHELVEERGDESDATGHSSHI